MTRRFAGLTNKSSVCCGVSNAQWQGLDGRTGGSRPFTLKKGFRHRGPGQPPNFTSARVHLLGLYRTA